MTRTTEAAIRQIMETSLTSPQINAFIADANVWVTDELSAASLAVSRLEIIERYLACALIRLREVGLTSAGIGDISENYQVDSAVSDYLLRAAAFDPTGKIRATFLAPKPTTAIIPSIARVGPGFADDAPSTEF